jgi:hypothetical protein
MIMNTCVLILVGVFLLPGLSSDEVYYVDSTAGNDSAVGTSPSSAMRLERGLL